MGVLDVAISQDELERGLSLGLYHDSHQHAMQNVVQSGYHDRVVREKLQRPWLDILNEFLDPDAEGFPVDPQDHRLNDFDIEVIHISKSGKINPPIKCINPAEFKKAISEDKARIGTLIIAEDLSRAMIDTLGIQYDLEPEFFASHLLGTESFRMGSWESPLLRAPPRAPNILPDYLREAPYYTAEFRRPYHIDGGIEEIKKRRSSETRTPRGTQMLKRDLPDVFTLEKISVYKKKESNIGTLDFLMFSKAVVNRKPNTI
jgi:hypothetical protein